MQFSAILDKIVDTKMQNNMHYAYSILAQKHNTHGEMVEGSMAHAWKACEVQASAGSNPVLSAKILSDSEKFHFFTFHYALCTKNFGK